MTQTTQTFSTWKKPLRFAFFGALGCLLGALAGEMWLGLTRPAAPPAPPPAPPRAAQTVVMVLDTSGSMLGNMGEMKQAAQNFVAKQDFKKDRTAVINFESEANVVAPMTQNATQLNNAIEALSLGGSTRMDLGLQLASQQLRGIKGNRSVLLFTDGMPDEADPPIQEAQSLRAAGVRIVAIATGSADEKYLAKITGDPALVVETTSSEYSQAFDQAQSTIYGRQLTDSAPVVATDLGSALRRIAVWTALLSAGLALALLWGQANYLHRPLGSRDWLAFLASVAFGFLAGAVAQLLFGVIGGGGDAGRLISWALLGALVAWGMGSAIPNLDRKKSLAFGGFGGALAAFGFLQLATLSSDIAGRLMGATLLGGVIGLLVIFVEHTSRRFWLEIAGQDRNSEVRYDLNLGSEAVRIGSNREMCRIYLPQSAPVLGEFFVKENQVFYRDQSSAQEPLMVGQARTFDGLNVTLRQSVKENAAPQIVPSATPPLPMAPAPALPVPPTPSATAPPLPHASAKLRWALVRGTERIDLPTAPGIYFLGRLDTNDIMVNDDAVSSRHAQIEVGSTGIWFSDLRSTNGSSLNGVPLNETPTELHAGDTLIIGRDAWRVEQSPVS